MTEVFSRNDCILFQSLSSQDHVTIELFEVGGGTPATTSRSPHIGRAQHHGCCDWNKCKKLSQFIEPLNRILFAVEYQVPANLVIGYFRNKDLNMGQNQMVQPICYIGLRFGVADFSQWASIENDSINRGRAYGSQIYSPQGRLSIPSKTLPARRKDHSSTCSSIAGMRRQFSAFVRSFGGEVCAAWVFSSLINPTPIPFVFPVA